MKIVSLACSNTEIVCALGLADDLVGVDDHSDYPADVVATLPRVGPDLEIDSAKVAALKPDLVLASLTVPGHEKVVKSIEAAGLPVRVLAPTSLEGVFETIAEIGAAADAEAAAAALVARMKESMPFDASTSAKPEVLIQWWPKPVIAPGCRSWVNDLLNRAGAHNPLADEAVISRPLSDDELKEIDPDAIVLSWCGVPAEKVRTDVVYDHPLWQDVAAIRNRQVISIPEALLGRPGPRLVEGYEALLHVVEACR
jgi:iron complex transport system substrate-binding protein